MLNTYSIKGGSYSNTTRINAVSGTLVKNHPKSFFERFHLNSEYAKQALSSEPHIRETRYSPKTPVIVLQIMVVGDMEVIAEIVRESEYDVFDIEEVPQ